MRPLTAAPFLLSITLLAAACSGGPPAGTTGAPPASAAPTAAPSSASAAPSADPASSAPATAGTVPTPGVELTQPWATAELTDVATGETFRLADLAGTPMIIETMAIWCSSCFAQQGHVYEVLGDMEPGSVVYIVLDIDQSESAAELADYRERNGFTGRYVVASRDLARALVDEFGDQMLNPPVTPIVIVGADGTVTLTPFGRKSPDDLRSLLAQHGA